MLFRWWSKTLTVFFRIAEACVISIEWHKEPSAWWQATGAGHISDNCATDEERQWTDRIGRWAEDAARKAASIGLHFSCHLYRASAYWRAILIRDFRPSLLSTSLSTLVLYLKGHIGLYYTIPNRTDIAWHKIHSNQAIDPCCSDNVEKRNATARFFRLINHLCPRRLT